MGTWLTLALILYIHQNSDSNIILNNNISFFIYAGIFWTLKADAWTKCTWLQADRNAKMAQVEKANWKASDGPNILGKHQGMNFKWILEDINIISSLTVNCLSQCLYVHCPATPPIVAVWLKVIQKVIKNIFIFILESTLHVYEWSFVSKVYVSIYQVVNVRYQYVQLIVNDLNVYLNSI